MLSKLLILLLEMLTRGVVSRISSGDDLAKRAKAEERRERRAARRAALRARIRAGGAAVDFRRFKVGSLRDQLERSGVDSGPLAMLVHSLAHAMREGRPKKRRGGFLGRLARNILRGSDSSDDDEQTKEKRGDAAAGGQAKKPPSETEDDGDAMDGDSFVRSGETFRTVLAQEKLSTLSGFVRAEERVRGEHATTYEHRAPVAAGSLDAARVRRDALRAAANAAANAARDLRANPAHDPETAAVVNFVGGLSLDDLRQELEGNSLLARGLDECVEALLETEWVGGVDGYVERRGERERWREAWLHVLENRRPGDLVAGMAAPVGELYLDPGATDLRHPRQVTWLDAYRAHVPESWSPFARRSWFVIREDSLVTWQPEERASFRAMLREECRLSARFPVSVTGRELAVEVYVRE